MGDLDRNRADQFDRADFAARPLRATLARATPAPAQSPPLPAAPSLASEPPRAAPPAQTAVPAAGEPDGDAGITAAHLRELGWSQAKIEQILSGPEPEDAPEDSTTQTAAYLRSLGWTESDIARLLVGPEQSHLTAEALFRQHAANSDADQQALVKALAQAGAQKVKPDPSLLSGLNTAHLSPESPSDLEQLISQFAALPDVQKQRFLLLLDSQKPAPKSAPPKADAPPKKAGSAEGGTSTPSGSAGDVLPVVKSSLDLLSTALKGLLGATKGGTKKGTSGSGPGTSGKNTPVDEFDSEDPANAEEEEKEAKEDNPDEDTGSSDEVPDLNEDMEWSMPPEESLLPGSESEPD